MCCKNFLMWYNEYRKTTAQAVRANPIGCASWGTIAWRAYTNQHRPTDLLLGCARNKVGCQFYSEKKIHPATGKFWGGFLMSGLLYCKNI